MSRQARFNQMECCSTSQRCLSPFRNSSYSLLINRLPFFSSLFIRSLLFFYLGFKPASFHSSRKDRSRDGSERQTVQRPEDFMDDEVCCFFRFLHQYRFCSLLFYFYDAVRRVTFLALQAQNDSVIKL